MSERLFHVSDDPHIERFDPRPAPNPQAGQVGTMVWAIGERLLHNYLLPRNCPRVTFYVLPTTTAADRARLLCGTNARFVIAIESAWWHAVRSARLYLYELPAAPFVQIDQGAAYYIAREPIYPLAVEPIDDLLTVLLARDVELRIMPSLWQLYDQVVGSSLQYSIIRMRYAQPRPAL
jgi:hypothetical protein